MSYSRKAVVFFDPSLTFRASYVVVGGSPDPPTGCVEPLVGSVCEGLGVSVLLSLARSVIEGLFGFPVERSGDRSTTTGATVLMVK